MGLQRVQLLKSCCHTIASNESRLEEQDSFDLIGLKSRCSAKQEVHPTLAKEYRLHSISFEKDNDDNYHMDLVAGFANMRARNYRIPEVDKLKAKLIAGNIIPAIATATALATGELTVDTLSRLSCLPLS